MKINNLKYAEKLAKEKAIEWGIPTRVHPCSICKSLHITTKGTLTESGKLFTSKGRSSATRRRNQPETVRKQRLRRKRRLKFPVETWENEGGALLHSEE